MADSVLRVSVLGDISDLQKKLDHAGKATAGFGDKLGKTGALVAGALSGAAVIAFGKASVQAFTESAQAQSKLELALKNSNLTVGVHAKEFEKLNSELAKHTLLDDDAIAATEAVMATFGASKAQIQQLIPTVVDLAAKMGVDGPAAADLFDKAALGSVKALKTLGIEGYTPTGDKARDLANVQQLLHDKVKGAAQAQLDAAAPGEKLGKAMDELQETVGSFLVPALQKLADAGVKITDFLAQHPEVVKMAGAVGIFAGAVWGINAATTAWAATQAALNSELLLTMGRLAVIAVPIAVVVGGVTVGNRIKNDDEGWKGKVNQILGGGGNKGIFGKKMLGIDGAEEALAGVAAGVGAVTGAATANAPAVDAMAGANVKAAASLTTVAGALDNLKTKDLSGWAKTVQQSIESAVSPTKRATTNPDTTFAAIQKNMAGNLGDVKAWQKDLEALKNRGFPVLAGELAKLGPESAKAVDEATRVSKPALQKMQDAFVARARLISDSTVLTIESELGGKLGPTLTRLGAEAAVFFGKGFTVGLTRLGADTGNILGGIAAPRSPVLAPAPAGGLLGSTAPTTNNVTINATTSEADARLIAKEVMWNLGG